MYVLPAPAMAKLNLYDKPTSFWETYHKFRPEYPEELFRVIFDYHARQRNDARFEEALDYGSGPGTILPNLLARFDRVLGTDLNEDQVVNGNALLQKKFGPDRVELKVGAAGDCDWVESDSADLITAAEAVHWFDYKRWTSEAHRILRPGGTLAFWFYSARCVLIEGTERAQECLADLLQELMAPQLSKNADNLVEVIACNVAQLDNLEIDTDLFINEERHKWHHGSPMRELSMPEPNLVTVAQHPTSKVAPSARCFDYHPSVENGGPLLQRKGWKTADLLDYFDTFAVQSRQDFLAKEKVQDLLSQFTHEVGGQDAVFDVAFWLSLVLASKQ